MTSLPTGGAGKDRVVVRFVQNSVGRRDVEDMFREAGEPRLLLVIHPGDTRHEPLVLYRCEPDQLVESEELNHREPAEQATRVALQFLFELRALLHKELNIGKTGGQLRFFLSHAKKDGTPLALSLKGLIDSFESTQGQGGTWYDVVDLAGQKDWREQMKKGVEECSVFICLMSEAYPQRRWCRQEFRWADSSGIPTVIVEARNAMESGTNDLVMEGVPVVRVPDGNLYRILFTVSQENLRALLFKWNVAESGRGGQRAGTRFAGPGPGSVPADAEVPAGPHNRTVDHLAL